MVRSKNIGAICPVRFIMSEINHEKSVIFYVRDSPKSWPGFHVVPFCCWRCGVYMLADPSSGL